MSTAVLAYLWFRRRRGKGKNQTEEKQRQGGNPGEQKDVFQRASLVGYPGDLPAYDVSGGSRLKSNVGSVGGLGLVQGQGYGIGMRGPVEVDGGYGLAGHGVTGVGGNNLAALVELPDVRY